MGYTKGASALTSIVKAVLAIEAGEIPLTFGIENLNLHMESNGARVLVVKDEAKQWPRRALRRASINL